MKRNLLVTVAASAIAVGAMVAVPVLASGAPSVPTTAKTLSGNEIAALYDGSTLKFKNFTFNKEPLTGTVTFDFKDLTQSGTATGYGHYGGVIRLDGDQFCHKEGARAETCVSVYVDGADIYEVDSKGVVQSVNQKQ